MLRLCFRQSPPTGGAPQAGRRDAIGTADRTVSGDVGALPRELVHPSVCKPSHGNGEHGALNCLQYLYGRCGGIPVMAEPSVLQWENVTLALVFFPLRSCRCGAPGTPALADAIGSATLNYCRLSLVAITTQLTAVPSQSPVTAIGELAALLVCAACLL